MRLSGERRDQFSSGRTGCEALAYGSRGLSYSRVLKSKTPPEGGVLVMSALVQACDCYAACWWTKSASFLRA
jgi:hypothetical protein